MLLLHLDLITVTLVLETSQLVQIWQAKRINNRQEKEKFKKKTAPPKKYHVNYTVLCCPETGVLWRPKRRSCASNTGQNAIMLEQCRLCYLSSNPAVTVFLYIVTFHWAYKV